LFGFHPDAQNHRHPYPANQNKALVPTRDKAQRNGFLT
jgi:hypothetical protein